MHRIQTMNNISAKGLDRLPRERFETGTSITNPDAILLRSADLHEAPIPDSVLAIARAGAGVNNVPVDAMTRRGIPVFNAPGANANAVKELVIAGLFLAARNIPAALEFVRGLEGDADAMHEATEAGKKQFTGFELPGRTLGVVGLGAIGVLVANAARALGMQVIGYDPKITVDNAWQLDADVIPARSIGDLMGRSDLVTVHVPLVDGTRNLIDASRIAEAPAHAVLLNFSRAEVVDEGEVVRALDEKRIAQYLCDFPSPTLQNHPGVTTLPHLGASTQEAQENCAVMAADQLRDYLETGNVRNAVNFPQVDLPRGGQGDRVCVVNANVPNMVGQISSVLARASLNIDDMYNKARGDIAYTVVDVEGTVPSEAAEAIRGIDGVLKVRVLD